MTNNEEVVINGYAESVSGAEVLVELLNASKIRIFDRVSIQIHLQVITQMSPTGSNDMIKYEEIAMSIYNSNENEITSVNDYILKIEHWIEEDSINRNIDYLKKYIRHIKLSMVQREFINRNINSLEPKLEETEKKLEKAEKKLEEIENIKGNIYTEFIAILGIFSTLFFALFGGFQGITETFSNIASNSSMGDILMIISMLFAALSIFCFAMLYWIAKITDRNVKTCGCKENCEHGIYKKFPLFINLLFMLFLIFSAGVYLKVLEKINGVDSVMNVVNNHVIVECIVIISPLILIPIFIYIFRCIVKKYSNDVD